tara:strand:+ start:47 stop:238 length:192 start_codon:yes stop_codon:yes gene_type:complete
MTNKEILIKAMDNPMNQIVIMSAIQQYCEEIADMEEPEDWGTNLFHWEAWKASAQDILSRIDR